MVLKLFWVFALASIFSFIGLWIFEKLHIMDKPWRDVPKRKPVPTLQGVVLLITFFILIALYAPEFLSFAKTNPFFGLLVGAVVLWGVALTDELGRLVHPRYRISPAIRMAIQIVVALIAWAISGVGITEFSLPGGEMIQFSLINQIVLTIARYLLFTNAINRFDGIYGLASWMSSIGFLTIFLLIEFVVFVAYPEMSEAKAYLLGWVSEFAMILFVVALLAAIIEFKPSGLLRDVGTMFLWFSLAYLSLLWGAKIGTMIVVLALPLFDAVRVLIDRLHKQKKNPFKGDYSHLHYRLLALGWNRNEVRVFIRWFSLFFMILMLLQGDDRIDKVVIFVLMAVIFFGVNRYLFRVKKLPSKYEPPKE